MDNSNTIQIINVTSHEHLHYVRDLIRAFVRWHRHRHLEDISLIDEYFDETAFEEELANLPGKFAIPRGQLLLALVNGQPAGCVALREIDSKSCEMKRMFVYERFHGKGVGHALTEKLIQEAKIIGYSSMKLDTSFRQIEAQKLYERFGFIRTKAYYTLPEKLENWLVFMELTL